LKVAALMLDYDGTIAPLRVPREESRIFRNVENQLRRIVKQVPVCVVTAKDFAFVHPRSRFASGWACVSGLDVRTVDGRAVGRKKLGSLEPARKLAKSFELLGSYTELKRGPAGEVLAVGIDWSGVPGLGPSIVRRLRSMGGGGRTVIHERRTTFADIYAAPPDKGYATKLLKNLLEVQGDVMFIGDSAMDDSAFQRAGIAVGVAHGQPVDRLKCEYLVEQPRLAEFLRSLSDRGMDFSPRIAWLRRKGGVTNRESRRGHVPDQPDEGPGTGGPADGQGVQTPGAPGIPDYERLPRRGAGPVHR